MILVPLNLIAAQPFLGTGTVFKSGGSMEL